jgi:hypothetical protein
MVFIMLVNPLKAQFLTKIKPLERILDKNHKYVFISFQNLHLYVFT